jgi:acyl transferase domain-containing protein
MHLDCSAIHLGKPNQALVLGASTIVNTLHAVSFSKLGLSPLADCPKSFDAGADSCARGQDFVTIPIKHLDLALEDGDRVCRVVTGSAVNANGLVPSHAPSMPSF